MNGDIFIDKLLKTQNFLYIFAILLYNNNIEL